MLGSLPPSLWFALAAWGLWVGIAHWLNHNPKGDPLGGLAFAINALYCRVWHRVRYEGLEFVPRPRPGAPPAEPWQPADTAAATDSSGGAFAGGRRGLIVVANHTAGIDPLVIQNACRFYINWMMTEEMRIGALDPFWEWVEIIFVGADGERRGASELSAVKAALAVLKRGSALGIFPEGRIARPRGTRCPFQPGLGLLVSRSGAPVLPVVIDGTPECDTPWASLFFTSRARVRFMPPIDYRGTRPAAIVADLESRFAAWTGCIR